mmetsp:Transcript_26642/g.71546  ORF Transcript_26642/g.71546 Transcript_26642/m.71546 type:complete len:119 (-) Transcript_26642:2339-2695(-)
MHEFGMGGPPDLDEAERLYLKAFDLGNLTSGHNLAIMYLGSEGAGWQHTNFFPSRSDALEKAMSMLQAGADKDLEGQLTILDMINCRGIEVTCEALGKQLEAEIRSQGLPRWETQDEG